MAKAAPDWQLLTKAEEVEKKGTHFWCYDLFQAFE